METFVFDVKTKEYFDGLYEKLQELRAMDTDGFPCRSPGCKRSFKYHSGRVKYVVIHFILSFMPYSVRKLQNRGKSGLFCVSKSQSHKLKIIK